MIKRIGIIDRVITAIIEGAILVLYVTQYISESTAFVLALLGVVYLSSSALSNILPLHEIPDLAENPITTDIR